MKQKLLLLGAILLLLVCWFALGGDQWLSFAAIKERQQELANLVAQAPLTSALGFCAIYIGVTALSLPGATLLTLLGGAIFGLWEGVLLCSFAASIGATLAFLIARFLLRDAVQRRFGDRLAAINNGVAEEGAFYLFGLRLVPLFPFFLINLLMALTPMGAGRFYLVSQLGMLPGALVYVNAGTRLATLDSLAGILSPSLLFSFLLLALFPLLAKRLLGWLKSRRS